MVLLDTEEQLLQYAKKEGALYIYGAGVTARLLLQRLKRYGIKWKGILTTEGVEDVDGERAVKFDGGVEAWQKSQALIIVAVKEMFHREIEHTLDEKSISNAVYLSKRLVRSMERIQNLRFKFQTHIVEHCDLKCRGCYHFSPLAGEKYLSTIEYGHDIQRIGELFGGSLDEILLLGGEPLLHPQVEDFFRLTRKYVPDCQLKILTNGLQLCNMSEKFWASVREQKVQVWVTKYPIAFDYDKAEQIAKVHGCKIFYFNQEPVRTLGHQPLDLNGSRDYMTNWRGCYRANECIDLKHGKVFPCIIPAEIESFNEYFGQSLKICEKDYVDIYKVKTAAELLEQLERPMPFCRYCNREDVSTFGYRSWSQTTYDIREWTE